MRLALVIRNKPSDERLELGDAGELTRYSGGPW